MIQQLLQTLGLANQAAAPQNNTQQPPAPPQNLGPLPKPNAERSAAVTNMSAPPAPKPSASEDAIVNAILQGMTGGQEAAPTAAPKPEPIAAKADEATQGKLKLLDQILKILESGKEALPQLLIDPLTKLGVFKEGESGLDKMLTQAFNQTPAPSSSAPQARPATPPAAPKQDDAAAMKMLGELLGMAA